MTSPITYTIDYRLEGISEDLTFENGMLSQYPFAAQLVQAHDTMITRCDAVAQQQRTLHRLVVTSQAGVSGADLRLDQVVDQVDLGVSAVSGKNASHPLRKLLFADWRVSALKRCVLGPELDTVRAWPAILVESGDPALVALAPKVDAAVKAADTATKALTDAQNANRSFRLTGERKKFIDDVNALRASTFGFLKEYVHLHPEANLPSDFASQFFRKTRKSAAPTVEDLDEELKVAESDLLALKEQRQALIAEREAELKAQAAADAKATQAALELAQKDAEAANLRIEALKAKLGK